jgi:23S rRNA (uracil1939-C5)-methyltransferase
MQIRFGALTDKGFARGYTEDNKLVECIGVLPGELAEVEIWGRKKGISQCNLISIVEPSKDRIEPIEKAYTSTAPLAIATRNYEHDYKKTWIKDQFAKHHIELPKFDLYDNSPDYGYRNKMEYGFYSDDSGLHIAFHIRGSSKGKIIVTGSELSMPHMNSVAKKILAYLRSHNYTAREMKSLILRGTTDGKVVAALFCKDLDRAPGAEELSALLGRYLQGIVWVYSDYRAPDSRISEIQHTIGNIVLVEQMGDLQLSYPWHSFFQVNPPLFAETISRIRKAITKDPQHQEYKVVDLYAGVGTIGLGITDIVASVHGVELSDESKLYATRNAVENKIYNYTFDQIKSEDVTQEQVDGADIIIVDPPRTGLMQAAIDKILLAKPKYIIYLSCNPATQARDMIHLLNHYTIDSYSAFNYYPRTLHVEGLAVLKRV